MKNKMWAIYNPYHPTWLPPVITWFRKDAIKEYVKSYSFANKTWEDLKKEGFKAIKVTVIFQKQK